MAFRMEPIELYSQRQAFQRGDVPDVYTYDYFSLAFRTQVVYLWSDVGLFHTYEGDSASLVDVLRREYGVSS